ncbi:hypothetical protein SBRCBS47491_004039 [Sporothrix bragantina]|uniref:Uncharacterized protein n=1 Tax=Sporothrix bragantina TaxID=671064 RepID=A0ABP0BK41_9PEZI
MGEMLFAISSQAQASFSNGSHMDLALSTSSTSYKPTASHIENDPARPRTVDLQDADLCPRPSEQPHQNIVDKKDEDFATKNVSLLPPAPVRKGAHILAEDQPNYRVEPQIEERPFASPVGSPLLRLPLEIRLQIYRWVLLLGIAGPAPSNSSSNNTGSNSSNSPKTATDPSVSTSGLLFHCMPPYFFDSPQHFGAGEGHFFTGLFSANAHRTPVEYRTIKLQEELSKDDQETTKAENEATLLAAHRPVGRPLPVGLLASCRQIYGEARLLAFETSEFVFVRLFSSGLSTAHAFIVLGSQTYPGNIGGSPPRLRPWQRDHLRYMRLELDVSVADMDWRGPERDPIYVGDNATKKGPTIIDAAKWLALCDALSKGLQGLRILLNITEERHQNGNDEVVEESAYEGNGTKVASADVAQSILVQGFRRLAALRQLEIELVWVLRGRFRSRAANMTPAATRANLNWCASVENAINNERQKSLSEDAAHWPVNTKVVCVERIYDEERRMA